MNAEEKAKNPWLSPATCPDHNDYFMGIAMAVRRRANCKGNRVAAVIVKEHRVISTGYNGVPEGMKNCLDGGCLRCANSGQTFKSGQGYDLCICVHAEQNALLTAARFGIAVQDAMMYTTMRPCYGCAKELLQAKIKRVYYLHDWNPSHADDPMDAAKCAEYEKISTELHLTRLAIEDPVESWAVTSKRKPKPEVVVRAQAKPTARGSGSPS